MSDDLKAKLSKLRELHELGLLTQAELDAKRLQLVDDALGSSAPADALSGPTRRGPPSEPADPLSGPTQAGPPLPERLGNYRILGVIGAGGMGTVVRARHIEEGWARQQGGDVALKLIHPHIASDEAFRERFFTEAALGKRVHHPGLATVYDVVSEGTWLGVVQEYVHGEELTARIRTGGLRVSQTLLLLDPIAEALDHLHASGIVHRDLKPANIRIREDGLPVLLDLGIAKDLSATGKGQTRTQASLGTSSWMAPEQADAQTVTTAADVYALGLIAYALLSGRLPWSAETTELRILTKKLMGELLPLSEAAPGVPSTVASAVMRALAVDPSERPASCVSLVDSLTRQGGRPPRPVGGLPRHSDTPPISHNTTPRAVHDRAGRRSDERPRDMRQEAHPPQTPEPSREPPRPRAPAPFPSSSPAGPIAGGSAQVVETAVPNSSHSRGGRASSYYIASITLSLALIIVFAGLIIVVIGFGLWVSQKEPTTPPSSSKLGSRSGSPASWGQPDSSDTGGCPDDPLDTPTTPKDAGDSGRAESGGN